MAFNKAEQWSRFKKYYLSVPEIGLALDVSRAPVDDEFFSRMEPAWSKAFQSMDELEKGAVANPDEKRMVGHYWLRNSALAPTPEIRKEIDDTLAEILKFAGDIHSGAIRGARGPFKNILVIGIGGSALGPQFVSSALGHPATDKMTIYFFDNTDPDGMDKVISNFVMELGETLCLVISKSGGTKETRNGMLEAKAAYERAGLRFEDHAVAVTGTGSELDKVAVAGGWIARFPMWDWVGGRTSELSAVGLLPAALQGFDIREMLRGAKECDQTTRQKSVMNNPASLLASAWYVACNAKGEKAMVVLPYKDRLELFSRYLQQLVMESLGKEKDLSGKVVHQGLTVYGNKGSTDQHAYIQQLRDGTANFFALFIEVLKGRDGTSMEVDPGRTSADYLAGFFLGTRQALTESARPTITLTLNEVSAFSVGLLIALFERAVGFYANLIHVNAYHQPGVEAGKKAAEDILRLKEKIVSYLREKKGHDLTAEQVASGIGAHDEFETVFKILQHVAANQSAITCKGSGKNPFESTYQVR